MLNISKSIFNEVIFPVIYDIGKPLKNMIFGVEPLKDIFSSKNNKTSPGTIGLIKAKKIENPLEVRKDYSYLLVEMLEDIKRSSKKALILTIPIDKEVLVRNHNPRRNSLGYPKDVITNQNIAQKNCIPHLSGYKIFGHLTEQEYKSFWPSIDGHWLQVGSDEFASRLAPKIKIALTERKLGC